MELFLATFSALFSVVNPFGAMPVFLTLTQDDSIERRNQQARNACFYMLGILVTFFFQFFRRGQPAETGHSSIPCRKDKR